MFAGSAPPRPRGDDQVALPAQPFQRLFFVLTKNGLPFPGENVADGPAELLFDQFIGIHKAKLDCSATSRPMVDLPVPMNPTRARLRMVRALFTVRRL